MTVFYCGTQNEIYKCNERAASWQYHFLEFSGSEWFIRLLRNWFEWVFMFCFFLYHTFSSSSSLSLYLFMYTGISTFLTCWFHVCLAKIEQNLFTRSFPYFILLHFVNIWWNTPLSEIKPERSFFIFLFPGLIFGEHSPHVWVAILNEGLMHPTPLVFTSVHMWLCPCSLSVQPHVNSTV